ncbi:taurine catabolism dioxygenase TauD, TfdA family-domain-containing protein [Thamnocephalis sphaerospora]|uniref:Taurine catabolism dioxygenase TauD, TfdA family-domain-containing protein n=1 Tax=Thamnocephalis sphaerospora TaxID=78915 RepID=A0A4P9XQF9_9FUNG|nr:taurine catabolism dioxygenase TauD, TfdA family-domain-containing protein [Thamnocephalis sphaerospora]|eukprot:RKP07520.1 taurine catabolism dioxygenase TauD, TfdA family-domain-containing protein [Thamnocephalis sphaerospora]
MLRGLLPTTTRATRCLPAYRVLARGFAAGAAPPVTLALHNGESAQFSHVWLRDHCPCPACVHPSHRQKMHSTGAIPLDVRPERVEIVHNTADSSSEVLEVVWSKDLATRAGQHTSRYPLSMLRQAPNATHWRRNDWLEEPLFWRADQVDFKQLWVDYNGVAQSTPGNGATDGLRRALHLLARYGLCFLRNVPTELTKVETVASHFGPVRETFYGRSWDVRSVPQAKNIAYTDVDLDLHMDLLYFESPPGLQLLHCLANSVTGGSSVFADSYRAALELRQRSPEDFEVLRSVPVTFHYKNDGHHMKFRRPTIIAADDDATFSAPGTIGHLAQNSPLMVNYAPPFQGALEVADVQTQRAFYRAFVHFESILMDPAMRIEYTLQEGECVIFANRRVLHGRRAFDASSGHRHLRGTYVDLDAFQDRHRVAFA